MAFRSPHLYLKFAYLRNQDYPNFRSQPRGRLSWYTTIQPSPFAIAAKRASLPAGRKACSKPCSKSRTNSAPIVTGKAGMAGDSEAPTLTPGRPALGRKCNALTEHRKRVVGVTSP